MHIALIIDNKISKMNFDLPADLQAHLESIDSFIHSTSLPLQYSDNNNRFFDHRREYARTDWENNGNPRKEWEELLGQLNKTRTTPKDKRD